MVVCMESWLVADPDALAKFYGKEFHRASLPKNPNLEEVAKEDLSNSLKKATKSTQKGEYAIIKHASKLLERIDRNKVATCCLRFATFIEWLQRKIDLS